METFRASTVIAKPEMVTSEIRRSANRAMDSDREVHTQSSPLLRTKADGDLTFFGATGRDF